MANIHEMVQIGALGGAIRDEAANYSSDPKEVPRLASQTARHTLRPGNPKDVGCPATIDCLEEGMAQRETRLGRSTVKRGCGPPSSTG